MEFISFFVEDGDGVVYEMATVSPRGTKHRLAPKLLHEDKGWIAAVLLPLRREK